MSNLEELYCCVDDFCQKFILSVLFFRHARLKPRGALLLIQPKLPFATISVFPVITYFRASHSEGKPVPAGLMALNFI